MPKRKAAVARSGDAPVAEGASDASSPPSSSLNRQGYNPDILTCLANLSSDEVFTPPKVANEILDQLPPAIWRDKHARFLDPFCKSGIFPREIARRLMQGLEKAIPNRQQRANHIFTKQIFAVAITTPPRARPTRHSPMVTTRARAMPSNSNIGSSSRCNTSVMRTATSAFTPCNCRNNGSTG